MFHRKKTTVIVAALFCAIWASAVIGAESYIFVDGSCGNDAWTGRYSQCFGPDGYKRTIQAALDAIPDGGNIVVRDGTYGGSGNRDLDFHGKAVRLIGGDCIIDCGGTTSEQHRAFHFHSGETESSIVQGFTVINGTACKGGAVLCTNSSPKFLNCTFQGNEATEDDTGGGAVYNEDSSPTFESCTFVDNQAYPSASYGGGITNERSSPTLTDCTFSNNHAWGGGGIYNTDDSNPTLENCTFLNNQAARGAGMANSGCAPTLSRCTFTDNSATHNGGGMDNSYGAPVLTHCTFTGNSAIYGGGISNRVSSPVIVNCLFAANSATSHGGAVSNDTAHTQLVNCTIYGNSGGGIAAYDDSRVATTNCILWYNNPNQVYNDVPACNQILYSCVEGGWSGAGNTPGDPLFADPDGPDDTLGTEDDDFSLTAGSACIDAGKNSVVPPTLVTDLAGLARFSDDLQTPDTGSGTPPIIDMGAYEYQGDIPEDGVIYVDDDAAGTNNGSSWANAFKYLQDALAAAGECEIRVAQGTYKPDRGAGITPGSRDATFQLINNIVLKGGYAGLAGPDHDAWDVAAYQTILSGDLSDNDVEVANPADLLDEPTRDENSRNVVTAVICDRTAIIDGFTITGGNADGPAEAQKYGGGIYRGMPTVSNCTIIVNSANIGGGGIYFYYGEQGLVPNCTVAQNAAPTGGGIYGCSVLSACVIDANSATSYGVGGVYLCRGCDTALTDCTFSSNSAVTYGGVVMLVVSVVTPIFTRFVFIGNSTEGIVVAVSGDGSPNSGQRLHLRRLPRVPSVRLHRRHLRFSWHELGLPPAAPSILSVIRSPHC